MVLGMRRQGSNHFVDKKLAQTTLENPRKISMVEPRYNL